MVSLNSVLSICDRMKESGRQISFLGVITVDLAHCSPLMQMRSSQISLDDEAAVWSLESLSYLFQWILTYLQPQGLFLPHDWSLIGLQNLIGLLQPSIAWILEAVAWDRYTFSPKIHTLIPLGTDMGLGLAPC